MSSLMRPPGAWANAQALRQLFDQLADPVLVFDSQAVLSFGNKAALRMLGCEPGQAMQDLASVLGPACCHWLQNAMLGSKPAAALPAASFLDGRTASLSWQALGAGYSAVHLGHVQAHCVENLAPGDQSARWPVRGQALKDLLTAIWDSPFPVALLDGHFRLIDGNTAWSEFMAEPCEALEGKDHLPCLAPDSQRSYVAMREGLATSAKGASSWVSARMTVGDGREKWFRGAYRVLEDDDRQRFILEILHDETAEHMAQERAERSARELDDLFELSPVGMVLFDEKGLLIRTNPAFDNAVGHVPVTLMQAPQGLAQLLAWQEEALSQLDPGHAPLVREGWIPHVDGGLRRLRCIVRCYRSIAGQRRFMAVVEDRSLEEARELAQVQIGALMNTAGVGLATFEGHGALWAPPTQSATFTAQQDGNVMQAPLITVDVQSIHRDMVLAESLGEYDKLQLALRESRRAELRYAIQHPEWGVRWLSTRVEPAILASGKRTTSVVTLDITEQQVLLDELSTILESTTAGIAYIRGNKLVRCNQRFEIMLGLRTKPVAGRTLEELFEQQPLAQKIVREALGALGEGSTYETEFEVSQSLTAGETPQWYALSVRRMGRRQAHIEAIALISDITRFKLQQRELEILVRDRELMFNLSDVGIAFVRNDTIERANDALAYMSGYSVEALSRLPLRQLFAAGTPDTEATLQNNGCSLGEHPLRCQDGRLMWVQVSNRFVSANDPSGGFIASYVNVDARHRAEHAVVLQAERTRAILDSVLVGIVTVGPCGIEWMNRSARRMFGSDLGNFMNQPMSTVATPEIDHPLRQSQYLDELVEGEAQTFECRLKARDGREFWVVGNAVVTANDTSGRQLTYALLDIDKRRQAEARIAEAQASLQLIIEAAPLAIILWDAATLQIVQINAVAARLLHRTVTECIGLDLDRAFTPEILSFLKPDMQQALASHDLTQREYQIPFSGELRTWDARFLPLATPGQYPDKLLLVASDITKQQVAQQAKLDAAIQQREMLVREVHHRIKNNLQGVAGLLQQVALQRPEVEGVISEVVGQVQAIAQVYGLQVGASGPLHLVNVLEAIANSVQRTFGREIHFSTQGIDVQDWLLPEAEAIPIALTINELLTNAIKHSCKPPPAVVSCKLSANTEQGVHIEIANVAQLPAGFNIADVRGGVSGLGLVRALLPRRSARLSLEQSGPHVVAAVELMPPCVEKMDPQAMVVQAALASLTDPTK